MSIFFSKNSKFSKFILNKTDPGFVRKIINHVSGLLNKLSRIVRSKGIGPTTEAGRIASGFDGLADRWATLLKQAQNNFKYAEDGGGDLVYKNQLREVTPVRPTTNAWERSLTTDEVKAIFPNLWDVSAEESETRNPTQVKVTVSSYRKIYDYLKSKGFNGTILDASSGLGYGTRAGIDEYGFKVDDIEPYPGKGYSPKYKDYSTLNKKYDAIISNAVLNVLPQDQRDALVVKMGEMLSPGGTLFVNVRGDDVLNASSKEIINKDNLEVYISNTGSYQKGFTKSELKAYLEDVLGDGYTVESTTMFGKTAAIVTKKANSGLQYQERSGKTKNATELTEDDLRYLLEKTQNGELDNGTYVPLRRNTPRFFADVVNAHAGAFIANPEFPMASAVKHLVQNMEEDDGTSYGNHRPHSLTPEDIISISKKMDDPTYIVKQKNGRYAEVVSIYNLRNKKVVVSISLAGNGNNFKYEPLMNGYNSGYYNIIVTEFEPDSLNKYLKDCEVIYDKKKMNGKYQVGSGRVVAVTHDTPFIENTLPQPDASVKGADENSSKILKQERRASDAEYLSADPVTYDDNGNVIPLSERFNTESNDIRRQERRSQEPYNYDSLISKPDMKVTVVNDGLRLPPSKNSRQYVVNTALQNVKSNGKVNSFGNNSVHVGDIDTDVVVSKRSIEHGLDRRLNISAPVILKIGDVLKNAIRINELLPQNSSANNSYILIGYAQGKSNNYLVRFVVDRFSNKVDSVDVLHAVNTKKDAAGTLPGRYGLTAHPTTSSAITIAQLLDFVNAYFPDILPEDVLRHYGYTSRPDGILGESALYQERQRSDREILVDALRTGATGVDRGILNRYESELSRMEEQVVKAVNTVIFSPANRRSFPCIRQKSVRRSCSYRAPLRRLRTRSG